MPEVEFIAIGKAHDESCQRFLEERYFHLLNLGVTGFLDPFSDDTPHHILSRTGVLVHPVRRQTIWHQWGRFLRDTFLPVASPV
jgi:hypothetical protein